MTELIVLYRMPKDPERFDKYYREVHGPMTSKLPGLKGYKYGPARAHHPFIADCGRILRAREREGVDNERRRTTVATKEEIE